MAPSKIRVRIYPDPDHEGMWQMDMPGPEGDDDNPLRGPWASSAEAKVAFRKVVTMIQRAKIEVLDETPEDLR